MYVITLWLTVRQELHSISKIINYSELYYNNRYVCYFQNPTSFQVAFNWQLHWVKLELLIVLQYCAQWHIGITPTKCMCDFEAGLQAIKC